MQTISSSPRRTLIFAALLTSLLFVGRCAALQEISGVGKTPGFELERLEFVGLDLQKLSLRLHTTVDNPYPVAVPRAAADLGLAIGGTELFRFKNDLEGGIAARGTRAVAFDVDLPFTGLLNAYNQVPGREFLDLQLSGPVKLFLPEGAAVPGLPDHMTFDVIQKTDFPAIKPTVEIRNFAIEKPSADEVTSAVGPLLAGLAMSYLDRLLDAGGTAPGSPLAAGLANLDFNLTTTYEVVLKNEAAARLDLSKLNYTLFLENQKLFDGIGQPAQIENNGTESVLKVQTKLPLVSITSALSRAIKSRNAGFRVTGDAGFDIPGMSLDNLLNLDFDRAGRLTW